jgi:type I restriction enzyme M protein
MGALRELGGNAGNSRLRDALGWQEKTYLSVSNALKREGVISAGRGRGGSVSLINGGSSQPALALVALIGAP